MHETTREMDGGMGAQKQRAEKTNDKKELWLCHWIFLSIKITFSYSIFVLFFKYYFDGMLSRELLSNAQDGAYFYIL